jgi:hypothetical protein
MTIKVDDGILRSMLGLRAAITQPVRLLVEDFPGCRFHPTRQEHPSSCSNQ